MGGEGDAIVSDAAGGVSSGEADGVGCLAGRARVSLCVGTVVFLAVLLVFTGTSVSLTVPCEFPSLACDRFVLAIFTGFPRLHSDEEGKSD